MVVIKTNEENRIIWASLNGHLDDDEIEVTLPDGVEFENLLDYLYVDGKFILDPLPEVEKRTMPTQLDMIEAQLTYTAMMTDTLLEV